MKKVCGCVWLNPKLSGHLEDSRDYARIPEEVNQKSPREGDKLRARRKPRGCAARRSHSSGKDLAEGVLLAEEVATQVKNNTQVSSSASTDDGFDSFP